MSSLQLAFFLLLGVLGGLSLSPSDFPPLPPPPPASNSVIWVQAGNANDLASKISNLVSDTTIVIPAGTYQMTTSRLTIGSWSSGASNAIKNIVIRGATGNPEDVVIRGSGMLNNAQTYGLEVANAQKVEIYDLSVGNVYYHALGIHNHVGADEVTMKHCILFDAGQQLLKCSASSDENARTGGRLGLKNGVFDYNIFRYTTGAEDHPEGATQPCYTNAIDAFGTENWRIRHNFFENIRCKAHIGNPITDDVAGPTILLWQGTEDAIVQGNTFVNCERGIAFGLGFGGSQLGGKISNNMFYREASQDGDVPIHCARCEDTVISHNTLLVSDTYHAAIEVRFSDSKNVRVENNLMDSVVLLRDSPMNTVVTNNQEDATPDLFKNVAKGNLHLKSKSTAVDQAAPVAGVGKDFDGQVRPAPWKSSNKVNVGADEWHFSKPVFKYVRAKQITHNSVRAVWELNEKKGSLANKFVIHTRRKKANGKWTSWTKQAKVNGNTFKLDIKKLSPESVHQVRVKAFDTISGKQEAFIKKFTTLPKP